MIPVGELYQPSGQLTFRSFAITLILGVFSAVIVAGLFWLWEISPIPTLVIITAVLQGLVIGMVLSAVVGRLHMRNPTVAGLIGFGCGLLSIGLVHYGHHLATVQEAANLLRPEIEKAANLTPQQKQQALAELDRNPGKFADVVLRDITGYGGFIGTMILRNREGVTIKHSTVSGFLLWVLWAGEALFVAITASVMARERASQTYCDDCGDWCAKQPDIVSLPGGHAQPLVAAIQNDQPEQVMQLRSAPEAGDVPGHVGVTLHHCPHCDQAFAEVSLREQVAKDKTKITPLLQKVRVSPEMADSLRRDLTLAPASAEATAAPSGDDEPTLLQEDEPLPPVEPVS